MPVYRTKEQAAKANDEGKAERCARCRQWHNTADKRGRRARGRKGR